MQGAGQYLLLFVCQHLPFSSAESEFAIMSDPTHKIYIPYGLKRCALHATTCIFNKSAGVDLIHSALIHASGRSNIRRENVPKLRKQPDSFRNYTE